MRDRMVKHSFWSSKTVQSLDWLGRLLFIGVWGCAENNGVCLDDPFQIAASVFPKDTQKDSAKMTLEVDERLWIMHEKGIIRRFSENLEKSKNFLEITNFMEHQDLRHKLKNPKYPNYQPKEHVLRERT